MPHPFRGELLDACQTALRQAQHLYRIQFRIDQPVLAHAPLFEEPPLGLHVALARTLRQHLDDERRRALDVRPGAPWTFASVMMPAWSPAMKIRSGTTMS